jgi:hypothetical protein
VGQKEKCGFLIKLTPNNIKINKVAHVKQMNTKHIHLQTTKIQVQNTQINPKTSNLLLNGFALY